MFSVAYIMKQDYNSMTWHKKNCHFLGRVLRFVFSIMPTTKKGRTERRGVVAVTETAWRMVIWEEEKMLLSLSL